MIFLMVFFVMLNFFIWFKFKVNIYSFKVKLEEIILCSERYVLGFIFRIELSYIIFYFVNQGSIDFLNLGF